MNSVRGPGRSVPTRSTLTTFEPVKTSKLRLEVTPQKGQPAGILEWRVYNVRRLFRLFPR